MIKKLLSCLLLGLLPAVAAYADEKPLPKLTVQLDWIAEPEHGGIYQALARGYFRAEGLHVTVVQGGPNAFVTPMVATGQTAIVGGFPITLTWTAATQPASGYVITRTGGFTANGTATMPVRLGGCWRLMTTPATGRVLLPDVRPTVVSLMT